MIIVLSKIRWMDVRNHITNENYSVRRKCYTNDLLETGLVSEILKQSLRGVLTAQKLKVSIDDFFGKCDQIHRKMGIWSHLLKKSLMENLIFCAVSAKKSIFKYSAKCTGKTSPSGFLFNKVQAAGLQLY